MGIPVKSGIIFHRQPSSTSTVTKPSTTPTSIHAPSVPLASPSQRPKFTFTISAGTKANKTEPSKAKPEGKEHGEKDVKIGMKEKLSSSSIENASSEIKSPIASSGKISETFTKPDTIKSPSRLDSSSASGGQKEKAKENSEERFPLKKEGKDKVPSPKKPRPPPLFIPRPLAQGKGTPVYTCKLHLFVLWCCTDNSVGFSWCGLAGSSCVVDPFSRKERSTLSLISTLQQAPKIK